MEKCWRIPQDLQGPRQPLSPRPPSSTLMRLGPVLPPCLSSPSLPRHSRVPLQFPTMAWQATPLLSWQLRSLSSGHMLCPPHMPLPSPLLDRLSARWAAPASHPSGRPSPPPGTLRRPPLHPGGVSLIPTPLTPLDCQPRQRGLSLPSTPMPRRPQVPRYSPKHPNTPVTQNSMAPGLRHWPKPTRDLQGGGPPPLPPLCGTPLRAVGFPWPPGRWHPPLRWRGWEVPSTALLQVPRHPHREVEGGADSGGDGT